MKPGPKFDPIRVRAIGKRRLAKAARMFAKAHRWKRKGDVIASRKGTVFARTWEELGEALIRSGGLVKERVGYRDKYLGTVYRP